MRVHKVIVFAVIFVALALSVGCASATIYVPDDYTKIQWAVDNASVGDTIFVRNGTYVENVVVNKSLTLQGEDRNTTIIDGGGSGNVIKGTANGVSISGFTVRNSGSDSYDAGIYLSSDFNTLTNNILMYNHDGIRLRGSRSRMSANNEIIDNIISKNSYSGIFLVWSHNNEIIGNDVSKNTYGIWIGQSEYNGIRDNDISDNYYGIYLHGIKSFQSESNNIIDNDISKNTYGIYVDKFCDNNKIYHNNIIDNGKQAYDYGIGNSWNESYPIGGNYWSGHICTGNPSNGSQPYRIDSSTISKSIDHHPFEDPDGWVIKKLKNITVSPSEVTLNVTETQEFTAITYDQNWNTMPSVVITWTSTNTTVGTVSPATAITGADGTATTTFTALAPGTTSITASNGTVSDYATVTVVVSEIPNISWNMTISATNQLEPVVVGMHPNATDGYDPEFDVFAQTPVHGKVILILDGIYSTSIKKTRCYNESVSWNLSVGVPTGETTTLSWNVPPNVNLTIVEGEEVLSPGSQLGEGSHELTVTAELLGYKEFSIKLKAGWNMVSLPLIPDNCSVDAIFGSIPTLDTMPVVTWEAPSFVEVEEVEPKIGYWVFTPSDTTMNVIGKPITNKTLILEAGWNMVGTVGVGNLSISDIPNQVPERPAVTWIAPSFVETDIIEPGKSAWVFVTADTTVTMGKTVSTEMKAKAVPMIMKVKSITPATVTNEWNLTISATNQLEPVTFGIHPDATNGYDEYDAFVQTPVQGKVIMILDDIYATEINRDKLIWNLSVGVPAGQNTTLTWDSSTIPADVSLSLNGIDMKLQSSMVFGEGSHSFVISGSTGGFDIGKSANPYPSVFGTHNGTITPNQPINVSKMYTYPCAGTGGHSEYVVFYNATTRAEIANGTWKGYQGAGDYNYIIFEKSFRLEKDVTYNYTIRTGSYPQIHHNKTLQTQTGWINCTEFVDANGKVYYDWIPAIRMEGG